MPVTVAVCGTFQFAVVNVKPAGLTLPSVGSLLESPIVTSAVGWLASSTVNVAVPPASVVTRPVVGLTSMPTPSLSVFEALTFAGS